MRVSVLVAIFLAVVAVVSAGSTRWYHLDQPYTFEQYVAEFGKTYDSAEHAQRKSIFEARLEAIRKHNQDSTKTWKQGVNHLTDHTDEENARLLGYNKHMGYISRERRTAIARSAPVRPQPISVELPTHVDWREKGVVSDVKDQGECGSCWTFATAETVESHFALSTGALMDLSEQQILDCTPNPKQCGGTGGCEGGTAELAMARIIAMGGLSAEWTYPYTSYFGQDFTCHFNATQTRPLAHLASYVDLPSNVYNPTITAVATVGPIAISVDAGSWFAYESGVYDGCNQTNPDIDHAVQLVGYGTDPKFGDYWLVRNSWSSQWGEKGYIRLRRTAHEETRCGTDLKPSDGTGCANGPATVKVCGTCGILYDNAYPIIKN